MVDDAIAEPALVERSRSQRTPSGQRSGDAPDDDRRDEQAELAREAQRAARAGFVDELLASLTVEDYTLATARAHAGLLAATTRSGTPRGAHDLLIAATAVATDRIVVTADERGFGGLPGVSVRSVRR